MYLTFAWRYVKAKKSTQAINLISWVTALVIAFATCCQVLVLSVYNGFDELVRSLYSSFYPDISVTPATGKTLVLDSALFARLGSLAPVQRLSRIAEEKALLQHEGYQTIIQLKGVDENYAAVCGTASRVIRGSFALGDTEQPGLVTGYGVQYAAGIPSGPEGFTRPVQLTLPVSDYSGLDPLASISEGTATPTGVFMIQQEFDNRYALTNLGFVKQQMHLKPDEYTSLEIKLKPGQDPESARDILKDLLGERFLVKTLYEQNTSLYQTLRTEKRVIFAILTLILVIAAFNMISALTMLILEKRQDIATLRSLGAPQRQIRNIFLAEGLLLGGIGTLTGFGMAALLCWIQTTYHWIPIQGGTFLIRHFPVKIIFSDWLMVAATSMLIILAAAWVPARKAAARQDLALKSAQ